jgi:hypothetical protein
MNRALLDKRKEPIMKMIQVIRTTVAAVLLGLAGNAKAADGKGSSGKTEEKAKAYPLDTCVVTDEKLGGHGTPHVFTHEGREVKLCCKGCLKDFKKDTAKYVKKMEEAEKAKK